MGEIRALVVDDEPLARRGIRQLLAAHGDVTVLGECRDGGEALEAIGALAPELVFLDVQMPGLDGLEVVRACGPGRMPAVVFVTAYDEFAVAAFEREALDYLVKPVSEERFAATMARVRERLRTRDTLRLAERLSGLLRAHQARGLVVPTATGDLVLREDEIDWIEAEDYYAAVHARGGRHLVRESLSSLEARLGPERFVRVHRSALVRLGAIRELRSGGLAEPAVVLHDGTRIPVSRRRRPRIGEALRQRGR